MVTWTKHSKISFVENEISWNKVSKSSETWTKQDKTTTVWN